VGGGAKRLGVEGRAELIAGYGVDVGRSLIELRDLRRIDVEPHRSKSAARNGGGQRQADIAEPDDTDRSRAVRNGLAEGRGVDVRLVRIEHGVSVHTSSIRA